MFLEISPFLFQIDDDLNSHFCDLFFSIIDNFIALSPSKSNLTRKISVHSHTPDFYLPQNAPFKNNCFNWKTEKFIYFLTEFSLIKISRNSPDTDLYYLDKDINNEEKSMLMLHTLKLLTSIETVYNNGVPCHCSAIRNDNNDVFIFAGPSGSGKTTVAKVLAKKNYLFSEEFNLIFIKEKKGYVYSTPFNKPDTAKFCANGKGLLKQVFFLHHSKNCRVEPLSIESSYLNALKSLYAYPLDNTSFDKVTDSLENIMHVCDFSKLYISLDGISNGFLEALLDNTKKEINL